MYSSYLATQPLHYLISTYIFHILWQKCKVQNIVCSILLVSNIFADNVWCLFNSKVRSVVIMNWEAGISSAADTDTRTNVPLTTSEREICHTNWTFSSAAVSNKSNISRFMPLAKVLIDCWVLSWVLKENIRYSARLLLGRVLGGGGLGAVTLMTPEYLSIWNIKRWCQSRLSGCHYPSRGDEAGAIRRQVAWRQTAGTGHQLHVTSSCCTSSTLIQAPCDTLIPSHITQTYHHNPVTRRQVAWQPFMSSPHRTSRDPNTQQQTAGGWTGWIQIATGTQPPCFLSCAPTSIRIVHQTFNDSGVLGSLSMHTLACEPWTLIAEIPAHCSKIL